MYMSLICLGICSTHRDQCDPMATQGLTLDSDFENYAHMTTLGHGTCPHFILECHCLSFYLA